MIREFEDKDLKEVNNLLGNFNYKLDNIYINEFLKCLVYIENKIKGVLVYELIYDRIEIDYIIIDEKYRKQCIGSKLLEYLIKNNDVKNITLEVNENNIAAINLYSKYGFEVVAIRKNYYKSENALLMMKKLGD